MVERTRGWAQRVDIDADAARVWKAMTDTAALKRWCAPDARIQPHAGGTFAASVDRVVEVEAHIDVFDPGRRLRLIYLPSPALPPSESAIVDDFILEQRGDGTLLRLLGSGIPADEEWEKYFKRMRTGWQHACARLKLFVERGEDAS
jgi:uncharacterized protein YndB with AHSA1/START domain